MRKHPLDVFSLLAGLIVLGFAIAYLIGAYSSYRLDERVVLPLLLVGLGGAGLIVAITGQRRADRLVATSDETIGD
ncbi:MAG: hypothetical protein WCP26_05460 [Actinomycetes bacterium]